jgi:hypothetical protein
MSEGAMLGFILGCRGLPEQRVVENLPNGGAAALGELVDQMASPRLDGREEGSPGGVWTRKLIEAQLTECGLRFEEQRIEGGVGVNVLSSVVPTEPFDDGVIIVGAHYDHQDTGLWTHPGAYDNAAGVASLLQVACRLSVGPPRREVLVAFWDAEEPPTFLTDAMGSRWWIAHPTDSMGRVVSTITIDLWGEPLWEGADITFALGSESSRALSEAVEGVPSFGLKPIRASLSLVEDLVVGNKHQVWSDYAGFRDARVPSLFLSDGQNRRYHSADDTADAVDLKRLDAESQWLEGIVRHVADGPRPEWHPESTEAQDYVAVTVALDQALMWGGWSDDAGDALRVSRADLKASADHRVTRRAAQRLMCWAGPWASVYACGLL